jgi:hypothetical protein
MLSYVIFLNYRLFPASIIKIGSEHADIESEYVWGLDVR